MKYGVCTLTFVFTFDDINNCIGCGSGFSDGLAQTCGKDTMYRVPSVRFNLFWEFWEKPETDIMTAVKR
jgi:hypothetical protein